MEALRLQGSPRRRGSRSQPRWRYPYSLSRRSLGCAGQPGSRHGRLFGRGGPRARDARRNPSVPTRLVLATDPRGRGRLSSLPSPLRREDVGRSSARRRLIDANRWAGPTGVLDRQPVDRIRELEDLLRQVQQLLVLRLLELDLFATPVTPTPDLLVGRFWVIITNVERKIASSETIRVRVGQGL
jgi:hypothetical protein